MSVAPKRKRAALPPSTCSMIPVKSTQARLNEIADAIRRGARAESFQKELDRLLGTEMEPRDAVAEATWEETYRNSGLE